MSCKEDADSKAFKKQVIEAFQEQEDSYDRAQRFFLRPMKVYDGEGPCRPIISSGDIEKLMKLEGESEIYIEKFAREYERLRQAYINGMISGIDYKGLALPKILEFAKMRNYKILFRKGDVIRNPDFCLDDYYLFYNPDGSPR